MLKFHWIFHMFNQYCQLENVQWKIWKSRLHFFPHFFTLSTPKRRDPHRFVDPLRSALQVHSAPPWQMRLRNKVRSFDMADMTMKICTPICIYIHTLYYVILLCIYIYTCTYSGHVTQKCLVLVLGMAAHDFYWDGVHVVHVVHVVHGDLINCGSSSVKGVPIFKKKSGLPHCHWGVRIILYNGSDLGVPQ